MTALLLYQSSWTPESKITVFGFSLLAWMILEAALHDQVIRPLQTLGNVVSALREEDYSFRARGAFPNDALGELAIEVNALADLLAEQRTQSVEATALLRRVVEEVDVPLFAFDPADVLKLVNSAGERLIGLPSVRSLGRTAQELGLEEAVKAENEALVKIGSQASSSRWMVRRSSFRQQGLPHTLLVLSDVSRALREEERTAWQRLIRVLGHELNNSLTPIKSIAGSLSNRLHELALDEVAADDFTKGLAIIDARAASLNRFLQAYRQLAQMPRPALRHVQLKPIVARVAALETRVQVIVPDGEDLTLMMDPDQIEQMLINLVRNAAEAATEGVHMPKVGIRWSVDATSVTVQIEDNGPGLLNLENVFVPFYTTKPAGSGIGLVLCRQIAESHGGSIKLANRSDGPGCVVQVQLPINPSFAS